MKQLTVIFFLLLASASSAQSLYDYYLIKGSGLIARKDYEAAEFYLTKAVERYPDSVLGYYHRGGARYFQQKLDGALDDFNKTLEMDPKNIEVYRWRGMIYHQVEKHDLALSDYQKFLKDYPEDKTVRLKKGELKTEMGKYKEAEKELRTLLEENPKNAMINNALGVLYKKQKNYEKAFQYFSTVIQLIPKHPIGYNNRAVVNQLQGRLGEACTDWKMAFLNGDKTAEQYLLANECPDWNKKPDIEEELDKQ